MTEPGEKLPAPEVLNEEHLTATFSCGEPELDRFLQGSALNRQKAMLSRTYVVRGSEGIAGY